MARINIDEKFWGDPRFEKLSQITDENLMMTRMRIIQIWRECYHHVTENLTADQINDAARWFDTQRCYASYMLRARLCVKTDDGLFRISGADERLKFLRQCSEAGKASAEKRKKQNGSAQPHKKLEPKKRAKNVEPTFEGSRTDVERPSSPLEVPDPSLDLDLLNTPTYVGERDAPPPGKNLEIPKPNGKDVAKVIAAYIVATQKRFGEKARPFVGGKVQGQIRTLLKDFPVEQVCDMVTAYLQMDDRWFQTKSYDFSTFVENISKVSVALTTGHQDPKAASQWDKVWDLVDKEEQNGQTILSNAD